MASARAESPPKTLYHYTDQAGLLGVTSSRSLWATHVQYLNDGREFELCLDLTHQHLRGCAEFGDSDVRGRALKAFDDWTGRIDGPDVFVASFTERGDLLSQWRGYCSPGDGYSVGFEAATLLESAYPWWRLTRCLYEESEQLAAVGEYVGERLRDVEQYVQHFPDEDLDKMIDSKGFEFAANLMRLAPALKDESFSEEREWRLISPWRTEGSKLEVLYRAGRHTLIPYCNFPLQRLDQDRVEVLVGPTQYPRLSQRAVGSLLRERGITNYEVRLSRIPFRDW